uniref:Predicted protein n=1 Tax=Hordeum vulgare subsp. vulgare TaxID=112509 RepID=F2CT77_HORVV|nr:predicted protein [Hordeum vulgare subsp. vulgare]
MITQGQKRKRKPIKICSPCSLTSSSRPRPTPPASGHRTRVGHPHHMHRPQTFIRHCRTDKCTGPLPPRPLTPAARPSPIPSYHLPYPYPADDQRRWSWRLPPSPTATMS